MTTFADTSPSFQFLRLESFSNAKPYVRAKNGKKVSEGQRRWTAAEVLDEACRVESASKHVQSPQQPNWLVGSRSSIEACGEEWLRGTKYGSRNVRCDSPWLGAGVISYPRNKRRDWTAFRDSCTEFLHHKFGARLRGVVEHLDEVNPHIHFFVVPDVGEHFGVVHPGFAAQATERKRVVAHGESRRPVFKFIEAMRALLDEFFKTVANHFALARRGANAERKSRAEWNLFKAIKDAALANQAAKRVNQENEQGRAQLVALTMQMSMETASLQEIEKKKQRKQAELLEVEGCFQKMETDLAQIEELGVRVDAVEAAVASNQFDQASAGLSEVRAPMGALEIAADAAQSTMRRLKKFGPF